MHFEDSTEEYFEWEQPDSLAVQAYYAAEEFDDGVAYDEYADPNAAWAEWEHLPTERRGPTGSIIIGAAMLWMVVVLGGLSSVFGGDGDANLAAAMAETTVQERPLTPTATATTVAGRATAVAATAVALSGDKAIIAPYEEYVITQGLHGFSYGHMAVDLAAGKGATILSPISGRVTELSIDEWGNTVLVIENDSYQVLMLHGNYLVELDEAVEIGQPIGTEGNNGYTKDIYGNLCYGRECGYHTHLNIFDKQQQMNVDPFQLLDLR